MCAAPAAVEVLELRNACACGCRVPPLFQLGMGRVLRALVSGLYMVYLRGGIAH